MEGAFLTIIKGLKRKYRNESGKYFGALVALYNLCFEEPFAFDGRKVLSPEILDINKGLDLGLYAMSTKK